MRCTYTLADARVSSPGDSTNLLYIGGIRVYIGFDLVDARAQWEMIFPRCVTHTRVRYESCRVSALIIVATHFSPFFSLLFTLY